MVCSFLTNDKIYKYISNMGKNLIPYSIAKGEKNRYFSTPHFGYVKRENIKILNRWKQMKISLIYLVIMFQIVENEEHKNFIQIMIITYKYYFFVI